jgi:cell wall-associated NlpC family hydrolase
MFPYLWEENRCWDRLFGLVQTVYSIAGFSLPRDASQQAQHGTLVESLSDAVIGDLAFFGDTKGKITHVGILKTILK